MNAYYRDRKSLIIAVDFDGTVVEQTYPGMGKPIKGVKEALLRVKSRGHKIVYWTARSGKDLIVVKDWLIKNNYPIDGINCNIKGSPYRSFPKICMEVIWDDRNVGGLVSPEDFERYIKDIEEG